MKDPAQYIEGGASVASSLLVRLQQHDAEAWKRIVRLYYPLVRGWCQRAGLQPEDASDVCQDVFRALAGNVGRFRREQGQNSFRGWLYGITQRQLLAHWRRQKQRGPAAAGGSEAQRWFAEQPEEASEYSSVVDGVPADDERRGVLRRALAMLREGVTERTWQAFWRTAVEGHAPADVAADLGMSVNGVYVAKARLLGRLRQEFGDLID